MVNPAAGQVTRGDLRIIESFNRLSCGDLQGKSNGTVTRVSHDTVPLVSAQAATTTGVAQNSGPFTVDPLPPRPSKEVQQPEDWSGFLFKGKLNAKGAALSFVAPNIKDGKPVAQLKASELQEGNKKWCNAVIFYVVGYSPTIAAVHRFISQQWSC